MDLELSAIRIDGGTQVRAELNMQQVQEYAEAMRWGDHFPDNIALSVGKKIIARHTSVAIQSARHLKLRLRWHQEPRCLVTRPCQAPLSSELLAMFPDLPEFPSFGRIPVRALSCFAITINTAKVPANHEYIHDLLGLNQCIPILTSIMYNVFTEGGRICWVRQRETSRPDASISVDLYLRRNQESRIREKKDLRGAS